MSRARDNDERHVGVPSHRTVLPLSEEKDTSQTPPGDRDALVSGDEQREFDREERRAGRPDQSDGFLRFDDAPGFYSEIAKDGENDDGDLAEPLSADRIPSIWAFVLKNPVGGSLAVLFTCLLLLFVAREVFDFLQIIESAPPLLRNAGYGVVLVLLGLVCWSLTRLLLCVRSRRSTPRVSRADFHLTDHRPAMQRIIKARMKQGREALQQILADYPLQDKRFKKLLRACGMSDEGTRNMEEEIRALLYDQDLTAAKWIARCDNQIFSPIDECARKRVRMYALRVGAKTAAMPSGVADVLIVIVNTLLMLKDLCALYNVRTTPWGTCSLAGQLFMNSIVAARLEGQMSKWASGARLESTEGLSKIPELNSSHEAANSATEAVSQGADSLLSTATQIGSSVLAGAGKRVAEGTGNLFLISRLGESAISYLRPIK